MLKVASPILRLAKWESGLKKWRFHHHILFFHFFHLSALVHSPRPVYLAPILLSSVMLSQPPIVAAHSLSPSLTVSYFRFLYLRCKLKVFFFYNLKVLLNLIFLYLGILQNPKKNSQLIRKDSYLNNTVLIRMSSYLNLLQRYVI